MRQSHSRSKQVERIRYWCRVLWVVHSLQITPHFPMLLFLLSRRVLGGWGLGRTPNASGVGDFPRPVASAPTRISEAI